MTTRHLPSEPLSPNIAVLTQMRPALTRYFLRKTGSPVEAEDLAQDVLTRALPHAHWQSEEEAKGYLFSSAVNRWRDYLRKKRGKDIPVEWSTEAEEFLGSARAPEDVLIVREELDQVFEALEAMPERTRAVLILCRMEQMKLEVVAEMLGISARAVSKHLAKGIEALIRLRKRQEWIR